MEPCYLLSLDSLNYNKCSHKGEIPSAARLLSGFLLFIGSAGVRGRKQRDARRVRQGQTNPTARSWISPGAGAQLVLTDLAADTDTPGATTDPFGVYEIPLWGPCLKSERNGCARTSFYCLNWKTLSQLVFTAPHTVQICNLLLVTAHCSTSVTLLGLPLNHGLIIPGLPLNSL